jgi:hypothetical protein
VSESDLKSRENIMDESFLRLVNVFSSDDSDFDFEVLVPEGMTNETAIAQISEAIKKVLAEGVSDTEPDGLAGEIETALEAIGFATPSWAGRVCMETGEGQVYGSD